MRILALDSATEALSVSLEVEAQRIDRYVELERGQSEQLLPMVDAVLAEAGVTLSSLDAIAFGRGPGAFTGVRLAASVAQGLAYGAGLGVVPVSDLAAVAQRAMELAAGADSVLVVNDARMREVYWGRFATGAQIRLEGGEHVTSPDAVALPDATASWIAAGRGLRAAPGLADRCREGGATLLADLLPRASEVLALARPVIAAGGALDPAQAVPVYVRDHVAEASF